MSDKPANEDLGNFANSLQGDVKVADSHFDHPIDAKLTIDEAGVELTANGIPMSDQMADEVVQFLGCEPYSLDMDTGFDPADPGTWPPRMTDEDAKQAIFADCGANLKEAKALWAEHFEFSTRVDRAHLLRVLTARNDRRHD